MSVQEKVGSLARDFVTRVGPSVKAVVVFRRDGLPVASYGVGEAKAMSAYSALLLGTAQRVGQDLRMGDGRYLIAHFTNGLLIVGPAGHVGISVLTDPDANLGLTPLELDVLANSVASLFT